MSDTEYHKGKLIKIDGVEKLDTFEKQIACLKDSGYTFGEIEIDEEWYQSTDCILVNGIWYKFVEHFKGSPEEGFMNAKHLDNGEIEFELQFYNGGCHFSEAMEEAFNKMEKTKTGVDKKVLISLYDDNEDVKISILLHIKDVIHFPNGQDTYSIAEKYIHENYGGCLYDIVEIDEMVVLEP